MTSMPTSRTLVLVALVVTTTLSAVYLIGHAVAPAPADGAGTATATTTPTPTLSEIASGTASGSASAPARRAGGSGSASPDPDQAGTARPAGATPSGSPTGAAGTPDASPAPQGGTSTGADQHTTVERPRLSLQQDGGPYGSRSTTGSLEVALTFDDGPDPSYTPQTLALLRQYQVRATFCLVGTNIERYPELVRAIAADGHTLCNHSWSHDLSLGRLSRAQIAADLLRTNEAIRQAVPDARIAYFRQPGGNWTPRVVSVAHELGMTSLHWAVDPQDWRRPGAGSISATVTSGTFGGAIVLLHDAGGNRQQTVSALRSILPNLTRRFALAALPNGDDPPQPQALAPSASPG